MAKSNPCFSEAACRVAIDLQHERTGYRQLMFFIGCYEKGYRLECRAKNRTLADRMGCNQRTVTRRLNWLEDRGLAVRSARRIRFQVRRLTDLGREVVQVLKDGNPLDALKRAVDRGRARLSGQMSMHNRNSYNTRINLSSKISNLNNSANPPDVDPAAYRLRTKSARVLSGRAWLAVSVWLKSARSVSWARCKVTHDAFYALTEAVGRSAEWRRYRSAMLSKGISLSSEDIVRLSVDDAVRCGATFGTVETSLKYIHAVVIRCVADFRLPGQQRNQDHANRRR